MFMIRSIIDESKTVWLPTMGQTSSSCNTLTLTSPVQTVRASFEQDSGYGTSLQFEKDGKKKTYGNLPDQLSLVTEWDFNETN